MATESLAAHRKPVAESLLLASVFLACGGKTAEASSEESLPGVGEICTTGDEDSEDFGGFAVTETRVETDTAACRTGFCVVHRFQGRVSCPYGQDAAAEGACVTPFGGKPVTVTVEPQLVSRPPSIASMCSCPCRGRGPGPFCSCPSTMECTQLFAGLAPEWDWYCVAKGSARVEPPLTDVCERRRANCENRFVPM
jgi:hypothetical protein